MVPSQLNSRLGFINPGLTLPIVEQWRHLTVSDKVQRLGRHRCGVFALKQPESAMALTFWTYLEVPMFSANVQKT